MNGNATAWLSPHGAAVDVLRELQTEVGPLPSEYIELLRLGNGGEVGLRVQPLNFCLDSAEAALDYWRSGTYTISDVFVFGSNGGGEYIAFDLSTPELWPVVAFDPIDPAGSIYKVAAGFKEFLELVEINDA